MYLKVGTIELFSNVPIILDVIFGMYFKCRRVLSKAGLFWCRALEVYGRDAGLVMIVSMVQSDEYYGSVRAKKVPVLA